VEGPTSAVSGAMDGEANEAEGICRVPAFQKGRVAEEGSHFCSDCREGAVLFSCLSVGEPAARRSRECGGGSYPTQISD
ncbi:MAG: hypothetical protein P8Y00_10185, partial [Deltaproteobacteria bacterium]